MHSIRNTATAVTFAPCAVAVVWGYSVIASMLHAMCRTQCVDSQVMLEVWLLCAAGAACVVSASLVSATSCLLLWLCVLLQVGSKPDCRLLYRGTSIASVRCNDRYLCTDGVIMFLCH